MKIILVNKHSLVYSMKHIIKKVFNYALWHYRLRLIRDTYTITVSRWLKDNGDVTLRLDYPLKEDSIVIDVGGYKGEWASEIVKLYNPYIFIFEPVPKHYQEVIKRFSLNSKIKVFNFGLSDKDEIKTMSLLDNGSSTYRSGKNTIEAIFKDITFFLKEESLEKIDLIKINIEGGEYLLLQRMIEKKIVEKYQDIQVQFHNFYPNAELLRAEIRMSLEKSHYITYDYPFVWENWRKKEK